MRGLHNIGLTSETPIDHSKIKNLFDVANLLAEGQEENKDKNFFDAISDLSVMQDLEVRKVILRLLSKLEQTDYKNI